MGAVTPKLLFFFFYFVYMAYFYNTVYICGGGAHTWRSSNNHVGLGDQTQVAGLGGRCLYLLNYLILLQISLNMLVSKWDFYAYYFG